MFNSTSLPKWFLFLYYCWWVLFKNMPVVSLSNSFPGIITNIHVQYLKSDDIMLSMESHVVKKSLCIHLFVPVALFLKHLCCFLMHKTWIVKLSFKAHKSTILTSVLVVFIFNDLLTITYICIPIHINTSKYYELNV